MIPKSTQRSFFLTNRVFEIKNFCWKFMIFAGVNTGKETSQLTFTCSKPIIKTLEKGVKYVQS